MYYINYIYCIFEYYVVSVSSTEPSCYNRGGMILIGSNLTDAHPERGFPQFH